MEVTRIALGIGVAVLIALAVGCSGPAKAPSLTPSTVSKTAPNPPAPVSTVPLAKVKSISQAKPIDPSTAKGPRLAIDADEVDFGDVPYQTAVAFSFNVKDVGSSPISLGPAFVRVKEGC